MHFYKLNFWPVDQRPGFTRFRAAPESTLAASPVCATCKGFIGSEQIVPPIRVSLVTYGAQFGDVAFGSVDQILVSKRFKQAYEARDMRGLESFNPVEVLEHVRHNGMADDVAMPPYYHCPIVRSRAIFDQAASEFEWDGPPSKCADCCCDGMLLGYERLVLMPESWAGQAIFYARGSVGTIVVTEQFRQMFEEEDLLGGQFIDLADVRA